MKKQNDYQELLKDPKWISKRNQILSRDNNTCQFCGCQDRYMQVHHKRYIKGNKPWEYEDKDLITLCNRCHEYITDEKNSLYESFVSVRDDFRDFGFSDAVFGAILDSFSSFFESIKEGEENWRENIMKKNICDAVYGTQNYDDVKTLAKLDIKARELVNFNYPIFLEEYDKIEVEKDTTLSNEKD